jgi:hypothetical protein
MCDSNTALPGLGEQTDGATVGREGIVAIYISEDVKLLRYLNRDLAGKLTVLDYEK